MDPDLFEAIHAFIQAVVNFEDIMKLKKLEEFHNLLIDTADLKGAVVVIGGFHHRQEHTKS